MIILCNFFNLSKSLQTFQLQVVWILTNDEGILTIFHIIMKGKINAYFEFLNAGFILKHYFSKYQQFIPINTNN